MHGRTPKEREGKQEGIVDSEREKVQREHAIMLAMLASVINHHWREVPPLNSSTFIRDLARYVTGPEYTPILIRLSEAKEILRKASHVALQTQTGVRSEMDCNPCSGNSKRILSATEAEKLSREHAIMLAMMAKRLNVYRHLLPIKNPRFIGWIGRFIDKPECRPLRIRLPEAVEVFQKALQVALETRIRVGRRL